MDATKTKTKETTMKLGDTVSGEYHGVVVTGVIEAFDWSGYVYVRPSQPVTIYGIERDTVAFAPHDRKRLTLVAAGPELSDGDVVQRDASCIGGAYLAARA